MSSPSQLFSCVDARRILESPVNNSTAKFQWSLARTSARFPNRKPNTDVIYDIPDTKSKRSTSQGFGKKTDLQVGKHPHQITPSPDTYNLKNFVEINQTQKKGFTPRYSRQDIAPMSYIDLQQKKVPGPGRYEQFLVKTTPLWSMRPRTSSQLFPSTTQKIVPGPGHYESVQNISSVGKYYTSKHKCSKSKMFNPASSKRFCKSTTDVPGPGNYNPQNNLSASGDYVLSKNVSAGKRKMMLGRRTSFTEMTAKRSQTPGPGSYRVPSDFGHYDQVKNFSFVNTIRTKQTPRQS